MFRRGKWLLLLGLISSHTFANTEDEIKHLLRFVEETDCSYERNGRIHDGRDAAKHIKKKYRYFKDDILSAEDFIKYSATKSRVSGKHYKVHCEHANSINSRDWLLAELVEFRENKK